MTRIIEVAKTGIRERVIPGLTMRRIFANAT